ncbi:hypothetical protein ACIQU5_11700 [Streptomyces sp. NPDC090306]|uniref:hypothetical protein n=1 Tax=Streptomyces sp. NPDC090306 TaxID=3365961 RepID=UPI00382C6DDC
MRVTFSCANDGAAADQLKSFADHLDRHGGNVPGLDVTVRRDQESRWLSDPVALVTALLGTASAATQLLLHLREWRQRRLGAGQRADSIRIEVDGDSVTLQELVIRLESAARDGDTDGDDV